MNFFPNKFSLCHRSLSLSLLSLVPSTPSTPHIYAHKDNHIKEEVNLLTYVPELLHSNIGKSTVS
jgi:hypothetical protein